MVGNWKKWFCLLHLPWLHQQFTATNCTYFRQDEGVRRGLRTALLVVALVACYLSGQLLSNLLQLLPGCHGVSTPRCIEEDERHLRHAPETLHLVYLTQVEVHHRGIGSEEAHRRSRWSHHILGPAAERRDFRLMPGAELSALTAPEGVSHFICL